MYARGRAGFLTVEAVYSTRPRLRYRLKEGDCFGEMAYLSGDRARRSASIISVSEVQLLKILAQFRR